MWDNNQSSYCNIYNLSTRDWWCSSRLRQCQKIDNKVNKCKLHVPSRAVLKKHIYNNFGSITFEQLAEPTQWTNSKSPLQRSFLHRFCESQNLQQSIRRGGLWEFGQCIDFDAIQMNITRLYANNEIVNLFKI